MRARLAQTRCRNHPDREAAARCPECRLHFCRECVIEHQGRLLCATCLSKSGDKRKRHRRGLLRPTLRALGTVLGFLLIWMILLVAGDLLTRIPETYHGTTTMTTAAQP